MVRTEADLSRMVARLAEELSSFIKVAKVILYGSYARGEASEWSDVDLAVISDDFKRMKPRQRQDLLYQVAHRCDPTIQPWGYTLEEYNNASHLTFLGEIKRTGVVVYEAV